MAEKNPKEEVKDDSPKRRLFCAECLFSRDAEIEFAGDKPTTCTICLSTPSSKEEDSGEKQKSSSAWTRRMCAKCGEWKARSCFSDFKMDRSMSRCRECSDRHRVRVAVKITGSNNNKLGNKNQDKKSRRNFHANDRPAKKPKAAAEEGETANSGDEKEDVLMKDAEIEEGEVMGKSESGVETEVDTEAKSEAKPDATIETDAKTDSQPEAKTKVATAANTDVTSSNSSTDTSYLKKSTTQKKTQSNRFFFQDDGVKMWNCRNCGKNKPYIEFRIKETLKVIGCEFRFCQACQNKKIEVLFQEMKCTDCGKAGETNFSKTQKRKYIKNCSKDRTGHIRCMKCVTAFNAKNKEDKKLRHVNCRHFMRGFCAKGDACPYSHTKGTRFKQHCLFYLNGWCSKKERCTYSHDVATYPCIKFNEHRFSGAEQCQSNPCFYSHKEISEGTYVEINEKRVTALERWSGRKKKRSNPGSHLCPKNQQRWNQELYGNGEPNVHENGNTNKDAKAGLTQKSFDSLLDEHVTDKSDEEKNDGATKADPSCDFPEPEFPDAECESSSKPSKMRPKRKRHPDDTESNPSPAKKPSSEMQATEEFESSSVSSDIRNDPEELSDAQQITQESMESSPKDTIENAKKDVVNVNMEVKLPTKDLQSLSDDKCLDVDVNEGQKMEQSEKTENLEPADASSKPTEGSESESDEEFYADVESFDG